jgi:LPXTG-motif cell wall-anchored protein
MKKWFAALLTFVLLSSMYSIGAQAQDTKNCGDFASKQEVMDFWYSNGYSATNDPHNLDGDADGYPCEVSKGEYESYISNKQGTGGTGGTLPNTASNNVQMMLMGAGIVAVGVVLLFRRKKLME